MTAAHASGKRTHPSALKPEAAEGQSHIVMMVMDDLGWNDLGIDGFGSGNRMQSPELRSLAQQGIKLLSWYVQRRVQ